MATLQTQVSTLTAQNASLTVEANSYLAETNTLGYQVYQTRQEINAYAALYSQMLGVCWAKKGVC
jgi:hypothetical protein